MNVDPHDNLVNKCYKKLECSILLVLALLWPFWFHMQAYDIWDKLALFIKFRASVEAEITQKIPQWFCNKLRILWHFSFFEDYYWLTTRNLNALTDKLMVNYSNQFKSRNNAKYQCLICLWWNYKHLLIQLKVDILYSRAIVDSKTIKMWNVCS